jgi:hypothetical protein
MVDGDAHAEILQPFEDDECFWRANAFSSTNIFVFPSAMVFLTSSPGSWSNSAKTVGDSGGWHSGLRK